MLPNLVRMHGKVFAGCLQQLHPLLTGTAVQNVHFELVLCSRVKLLTHILFREFALLQLLTLHSAPKLISGQQPQLCDIRANFFVIFLIARDFLARTASCDMFNLFATSASECPSTRDNSRIC